jgi:hypothetical protein
MKSTYNKRKFQFFLFRQCRPHNWITKWISSFCLNDHENEKKKYAQKSSMINWSEIKQNTRNDFQSLYTILYFFGNEKWKKKIKWFDRKEEARTEFHELWQNRYIIDIVFMYAYVTDARYKTKIKLWIFVLSRFVRKLHRFKVAARSRERMGKFVKTQHFIMWLHNFKSLNNLFY